jgi:hypothetical protein
MPLILFIIAGGTFYGVWHFQGLIGVAQEAAKDAKSQIRAATDDVRQDKERAKEDIAQIKIRYEADVLNNIIDNLGKHATHLLTSRWPVSVRSARVFPTILAA